MTSRPRRSGRLTTSVLLTLLALSATETAIATLTCSGSQNACSQNSSLPSTGCAQSSVCTGYGYLQTGSSTQACPDGKGGVASFYISNGPPATAWKACASYTNPTTGQHGTGACGASPAVCQSVTLYTLAGCAASAACGSVDVSACKATTNPCP